MRTRKALCYNRIVSVRGPKTAILICGDAGPARHVLLSRRDIRLFWADSVRDARATIKTAQLKLCIARPKLRDGKALDLFPVAAKHGSPPFLMLFKRPDWIERSSYLEAGAEDLLDHHDADALLDKVSSITGLMFARNRRVALDVHGEVKVVGGGKTYHVQARDLSTTGVGVKGLSDQEPETLVKTTLLIDGRPHSYFGRVQRCWTQDGEKFAGIRFIALSEDERLELSGLVESRDTVAPPKKGDLASIFDDIELPQDHSDEAVSLEENFTTARNIRSSTLPPPAMIREGSPLSAPLARIQTKVRSAKGQGVPFDVAEQARAALADLEELAQEQTGDLLADLSEARAAMLREYLERE